MKLLKYISFVLVLAGMASCSDEPEAADDQVVTKLLIQSVCEYDMDFFNTPANPPEYLLINSARDITALPEGTLAIASEYEYSKVDFAENTLIVVTSVIYCEPKIDEDDWNWARADLTLTKDYQLNIRYSQCSVIPTPRYTLKCKIQVGLTTSKLPASTRLTITESHLASASD